MLKRNLLVATALATIAIGSSSKPVYGLESNQIEEIGKEIRKGAARQIAPVAARAIVREFENKVLRGTPYVVRLPSGEEVPVLDKTPVLTKLTATIFEKIGLQPIGAALKAATQLPMVKDYMEFKIRTALTEVAENRIQAILEETNILEAAMAMGTFARKAMGLAGDMMKGDDVSTAEYKRLATLGQQMKAQLSHNLSLDEKAAQYYQDYFDMLIRSTVRGYLEEASTSFLSTLSKDALKAAEVQLDEYVIKPVGVAGAFAGGAVGAAGGGVGAAAGGAAGYVLANQGVKAAKQRFVALIDQKREEAVKDLGRTISLGALPLTAFEVMRPDKDIQSTTERLDPKLGGEWVYVDQYALDSSTGPTEIETDQTLVVVPEDMLLSQNSLTDSFVVLTPTPAPSFGGYARAAAGAATSKVGSVAKGAYNWMFGKPAPAQAPVDPSPQQILEETQAIAEAGYAETQMTPAPVKKPFWKFW